VKRLYHVIGMLICMWRTMANTVKDDGERDDGENQEGRAARDGRDSKA